MRLDLQWLRTGIPILVVLTVFPVSAEDREPPRWEDLTLRVSKESRDRVFSLPPIDTAEGFRLGVLVPPGSQLYDPFDLYVVDDSTLWVSDDSRGGAVYAVGSDGRVSTLADTESHPPISIDVAPPSFGAYAGQIFTVAFAVPGEEGGWKVPNVITRIDPKTGIDSVFCTLPANDADEPGAGSFFVRFGPEDSPYAGKLYVTAATNHTLYQVTPDGACTALARFDADRWGSPRGMTFSPGGETLLMGSARQSKLALNAPPEIGAGRILRVSPEGIVADTPYATGLQQPGGMAFAPPGFGKYGGQLFVADSGGWDNDVPPTEPIAPDGRVFRVTEDGELILVASGLANPVGVAFLGNRLVVSDINGDFHVGQHKIPIGFIVTIDPE